MAENTTSFAAAADDMGKILEAIRAPEKHVLSGYYIAQRSKDVADGLLQMARASEGETVTKFIASNAARFDTLVNNGQLKTLMETLEQLSASQQCKVLSATESYLSGMPDARVLKDIVFSKDKDVLKKLDTMLHGFDNQQRVDLFSAPMAAWWMSGSDQVPLMVEILKPLSLNERQSIVSTNKAGHDFASIANVLEESCSSELNALFKGCRFPAPRTEGPKL